MAAMVLIYAVSWLSKILVFWLGAGELWLALGIGVDYCLLLDIGLVCDGFAPLRIDCIRPRPVPVSFELMVTDARGEALCSIG